MIVCICKRVSESQIKREIRKGACSLEDLSERLGVGMQCGCCRESACELLEAHEQTLHFHALNASAA